MLYWNANFQIPNSGVQAAHVYAVAEQDDKNIVVSFYSDELTQNLLFVKEFLMTETNEDIYDFLLGLEAFSEYSKVE